METRSEVTVPARVKSAWREMLHVTREVIDTPASRITRAHPDALEVFVKSERGSTVYEEGERAPLGSRDYCEAVIVTKKELVVSNGRRSRRWTGNPDLERGMVSYLGLPLFWPEGQVFGTICVLDSQARDYTQTQQDLLEQLQRSVEKDLRHIEEEHRFRGEMARRQRAERSVRNSERAMRAATRQVQVSEERERAELAQQLHDDVVQGLTALKMDLASCAARLPDDMARIVRPSLESILETINSLVVQVRQMSATLVPPVLEDLGLFAAIEWELDEFSRRTGIPTSISRLEDPGDVHPFVNVILYRTLNRTLGHVRELPGVERLSLELHRTRKRIILTLSCEGHAGLHHEEATSAHPGLTEVGEEIRAWGGRLRTWQTPEGTAMLQVWLPPHPDT